MTTRRKQGIHLAGYDYLAAHYVVTDALTARGEPTKLTPTEMSMVQMMTEICADRGMDLDRATPHLLEVVDQIVLSRKEVLFPVYDERDNMGDETVLPSLSQADGVAA
jgi:hypothetical protein